MDELCQEVIVTSKPIREVAEAYGVGPETLRNWLIKYRQEHGGTETELAVSERARLKELERENLELRAETAFLKKPPPHYREGTAVVGKYEYIDSLRNDPVKANPVVTMCLWLEALTLGFYNWLGRSQSASADRR